MTEPAARKPDRVIWQSLGEILVTRGLLSEAQLALAFERQRQAKQRLGKILIDMGLVDEPRLLECLAAQFGKPLMTEEELSRLEPDVVRILPEETARAVAKVRDPDLRDVIAKTARAAARRKAEVDVRDAANTDRALPRLPGNKR